MPKILGSGALWITQCPVCTTELPASAKFCMECGRRVSIACQRTHAVEQDAAVGEPQEERKLITVLFADVHGSTELIADRDPEEARKLIDPVIEQMCHAVEQFGGTVSEIMGDGIMALFGAPIATEDHGVRACHAALAMLDLVRRYGDEMQRLHGVPVQIRVGVNSGDAVVQMTRRGLHKSYTAIGLTVHVASRMEQMAKPGTALATAETFSLAKGHVEVTPIGPIRVKGLDRAVDVAEIRRAATTRSPFELAPVLAMSPWVGRDAELQALIEAFTHVAHEHAGRVVAITGDAGIGKSRLVYEFLRTLAGSDALALDGGAAPYVAGAYRPGAHILARYFRIADSDEPAAIREKVAGRIIALGGQTDTKVVPILAVLRALPPDSSFHGLPVNERREQVAAALLWLARRVAADQPVVLVYEDLQWITSDTHDFLRRLVADPIPSMLVLVTYRSDYDAGLPAASEVSVLRLEGLVPDAARALIDTLVGADESLEPLKGELGWRSGGNPLFIEEHVRNMVDSGDLAGEPGCYRALAKRKGLEIPPSVRAVLAARIDGLPRQDKRLLQALAAVGTVATAGILEAALDAPAPGLRRSLRRLQAIGLLIESMGQQEPEYGFKHSLAQAVAYETLIYKHRRELHRKILDALAATAPAEVLSHHALRGEAWERAVGYLWQAGQRAIQQFAEFEAVQYLERALEIAERLPTEKRSLTKEIDLRFDLRNGLVPLGRHQRTLEILLATEKLAIELGDERRLAQALSYLATCYGNIGRPELALQSAERSLTIAERVGDPRLFVAGAMSAGEIHRTLGDFHKARSYLARAVELADADDPQSLEGQVGLPSVRARSHLAWTLAELGDFSGAYTVAEAGLRLAAAANHAYSLAHACLGLGGTRLRQGEYVAAVPILVRGLGMSEQVPVLRAPIAADLGVARARCGRVAEGLDHLHAAIEALRTIGRLSRLPLIIVKCGEVHLLAGEPEEAERLGRDALRVALAQRERANEAYARHLLAEVHRYQRSAAAEREYAEALVLCGELDMRPLAARCHAGIGLALLRAARGDAHGHLDAAASMFRAMAMRYWLERLAGERAEFAGAIAIEEH